MDIDDLIAFRGEDFKISEHIVVHQPTLDEISKYGELKYFQMVYSLTSVGADLKWQLDSIGVDYTKISDFELFYGLLIKNYTKEQTSIIFGDLDFSKFELFTNLQNGEACMVQEYTKIIKHEIQYTGIKRIIRRLLQIKPKYYDEVIKEKIIIDQYTYSLIADYLRKIHGLKRNDQMPANESTKQVLIEDAMEEYMLNKDKEQKSFLLNQISAMVNSEGFKYNHNEVWGMKIYAFNDSIKRIAKIKNANLLLQSGYSGYGIDLKNINDKQINWLGELD
jgi:hypothetical protein